MWSGRLLLRSLPKKNLNVALAGSRQRNQGCFYLEGPLRVLERAEIVRSIHAGRQSLFAFDPASIEGIQQYLDVVSAQWDQTLSRLRSFVED